MTNSQSTNSIDRYRKTTISVESELRDLAMVDVKDAYVRAQLIMLANKLQFVREREDRVKEILDKA